MNEPQKSKCFCLSELSASAQLITRIASQLPTIKAQYDKIKTANPKKAQETLVELHTKAERLWTEFSAVRQNLNEYGDEQYSATAEKMYLATRRFNYFGDISYEPLCRALTAFADGLPTAERNVDTAKLGHLMNRVRMGYFPTDPDHVRLIKSAVRFPESRVNILDPCCGEGEALSVFAAGENAGTYGVELDEVRAAEAQKALSKVGFGSFFHSRISSGAFHALFLNPPYLSAPTENGSRRLEKAFLSDSMRHLMMGGLLVYIIPHYRASLDVCRCLADNFERLSVYRFRDSEFTKFKQIVFMGVKKNREENLPLAEKFMNITLEPERIPLIDGIAPDSYTLPAAETEVSVFKGAVFNVSELAEQLQKSKSLDMLFQKSALDLRERRPLLPLNLSQIGLIGASGMMNGLIECDTPHIIKGKIVKEKKTRVDTAGKSGSMELREVTSNKMIFNCLTPDGFLSLS